MGRCPYCGSMNVERKGWKRGPPKEEGKKFSVEYFFYECKLCFRRFSGPEAEAAFLTEDEKADLVYKLRRLGLQDLADMVEKRNYPIHSKSALGRLYDDLKEAAAMNQLRIIEKVVRGGIES